MVKGFYKVLRDAKIEKDTYKSLFFEQDWASLHKCIPGASGGIHCGQMHQLIDYLGPDCVLQFGGGTIGHPYGIQGGAMANCVALEWMYKCYLEGADLQETGPTYLREIADRCPPLKDALEAWKNIQFEYRSTDTPDWVSEDTPEES